MDDLYENNFAILKSTGILEEGQSLHEYLIQESINDIRIDFEEYIDDLNENTRGFVVIAILFMISELFYLEITNSDDPEVKFKGKTIRKYLDKRIISFSSPRILSFFKWDLERRSWEMGKQEHKINYLKEICEEILSELQGDSSKVVEKYLLLLLEYVEDYFTKSLSNASFLEEIKEFEYLKDKNPYQVFEVFDMLKSNLNEGIDDSSKDGFLKQFNELAYGYLRGLIMTEGRYNNLFLSFIEAQCYYLEYLKSYITILEKSYDPNIFGIKRMLVENRFEDFIKALKSLFASVPNVLVKNTNEAYYHIFIHIILKLLEVDIESEVMTNLGRIDSVLKTSTDITIIEFKMKNNNDSVEQILDKKYYQRYQSDSRNLNLLGITFSNQEKNIIGFDLIENFK